VKSRCSGRREGIRVRSTTSPFARRVGGGPRGNTARRSHSGFPAVALSDKGARFDSSRPLAPRAEAWSGRSDRRSGSSTPSRVTGAPLPAAFAGRPRRLKAAAVRGNASLPGVLDLHVGCRSRRLAFDSSDPGGGGRRSGSSKAGTVHAVRREAIRKERQTRVGSSGNRSKKPLHRANPDDPKWMKRHEARHSPARRRESPRSRKPREARVLVL